MQFDCFLSVLVEQKRLENHETYKVTLPKNELENVNFSPSLQGQKIFVRFLGELKKPKKAF